ncbi:oligosaccharide flippase family protein [Mucilaginibacter sp. 14171R-50]|uniref:lipopolysaccharide biosynthesis protein n=1 Tax=Mucilaginibacter sp. 14171R-50 TaxID=2703789 RepID=UPI00138B4F32|nr:oligosaccharide flippase family protein [Mucilaginibacter sp. 14171R-50]QHS57384.1 oligosaccharide flippase family protein [Mucilaginibacter sp. 14171R-50]
MPFFKKIINKHTIALATNAAMPVIGMLVLSLMAHNLPKADFGNYIFFLMIFILGDLFRTGFLQTSLVKYYSGAHPERALNMAGSAWAVGFILTAIIVLLDVLLYIFYKSSNADMEATLKWFGIIYLTTLPSAISSWILQAEERFDRLLILQILNQGGFLVCILLFIWFDNISFQTAIYSYFATNLFTSLFCIVSGWAKSHTIKHRSMQSMKELANFGKYSVGTSISAYLLRGSDTFIIKLMFVPELIAVYYIPQRLMEIFEIPMRSFVSTALPELSAAQQRNDSSEVATIMKRYAGMLTVALVPVAVVAFLLAGIAIRLLFGVKYQESEAVNIFRLFMCYVMLMPVDRFFGITLDIIGKPQLNMIKVFLMLAINIIGDFVGIWLFHSLYAVAVASLFTFFSGVIFGYWALKKHLHFTIRDILTLGYSQLKDVLMHLFKKGRTENAEQL